MSNFSEWLNQQAIDIGGVEELKNRLPKVKPANLAKWLVGLADPSFSGQLQLSEALGVSIQEIRIKLGLPYTEFGEWLAKRIIARGNFADFPRKVEIIEKSTLDKWLNQGVLPSKWKEAESAKKIRDALIEWGDPTEPKSLLREVNQILARSRKAKSDARTQAKWDSSSSKIAIPCNLGNIA